MKRARGDDGNASAEEFAELARGNSEDPATAKNGGIIDGVVRKNINKPDDPLQTTLTMTEGAISEPIKYGNSYYILRRGESVPKSFADARQELLVSLRNRRSYAVAAQLAARIADRLKESKDVAQVAGEFAAEANTGAEEMIRETPFVKPGDTVPEIGSSPQFEEAVKPLANPSDVGERVSIKGGFAVPLLVAKKDPGIPDFEDVREQVIERVRQEQARAKLEQTAREVINGAPGPSGLKAASERLGLTTEILNDYKLGSPLGEAGSSSALDEAILNLKAGEISREPIKVSDNWVVVGATKRTDADLAEFAKQSDSLTETMLETRRSQVYEDYISGIQQRMMAEGKIEIHESALAQLQDNEPPVAAPRFLLPRP
ncbi:MAG: peptidyl-prolyl cis-trans isomerase [Pyrinomonadaceae bacterium]